MKTVLALTALVVATPVSLNAWALFMRRDIDGSGLLPYQRSKIQDVVDDRLLLFGDSTLGYAVDAHELGRQLKVGAQNLALNGLYGYAGDLNLIASIPAERLTNIRVVVMHTADMLTRPPADLGDFASAPSQWAGWGRPRYLAGLGAAWAYVWRWPERMTLSQTLGLSPSVIDPNLDYVVQRMPPGGRPKPGRAPTPSDIRIDKLAELASLAEWCAKHDIEVWYCHGPLESSVAEAARDYFIRANQLITRAGFKLVNVYPLRLEGEALGNTEDHVHPDFKNASTRWYAERLRAAFAGAEPYDHADAIGIVDPAAPVNAVSP